ncbi:hypothetical protein T07_12622 [Trichinella nelsoni]|uniref:Uncharacterized protein n=1 Tax=Trichinella nelsoni TaxID=6336 RepID=A0A0V0RVH3_9BILA|nr:hypothetical protein T07_12622 [Trichinella nelsoni]
MVNSEGGESKRSLLSTAFRVFDPIGCLAPFTVLAKMFLQTLWQHGTSWDEPLPHDVKEQWRRWKQELLDLSKIRLPSGRRRRSLRQIPHPVAWPQPRSRCPAARPGLARARSTPSSRPSWTPGTPKFLTTITGARTLQRSSCNGTTPTPLMHIRRPSASSIVPAFLSKESPPEAICQRESGITETTAPVSSSPPLCVPVGSR